MNIYAIAPVEKISFEIRRAAEMALAGARKDLKLPMVTIKWFYKVEARHNPYNPHAPVNFDVFGLGTFQRKDDILGLFKGDEPNVVYIRAGQTAEATRDTVHHECFHVLQLLNGFGFADHSEGIAQGYADYMLKMHNSQDLEESAYYEYLSGGDEGWASPRNAKAMLRALGKDKPAAAPDSVKDPDRYAGGFDKYTGMPTERAGRGDWAEPGRKTGFGRIVR